MYCNSATCDTKVHLFRPYFNSHKNVAVQLLCAERWEKRGQSTHQTFLPPLVYAKPDDRPQEFLNKWGRVCPLSLWGEQVVLHVLGYISEIQSHSHTCGFGR